MVYGYIGPRIRSKLFFRYLLMFLSSAYIDHNYCGEGLNSHTTSLSLMHLASFIYEFGSQLREIAFMTFRLL